MHRKEPFRTSNTGWLISDLIPKTQVELWSRTASMPILDSLLDDDQKTPVLVFPSDNSTEEIPTELLQAESSNSLVFVILDGTWREASRMERLHPKLRNLPRINWTFTNTKPISQYRLRRSDDPSRWSTCEAAAACLQVIGENDLAFELLAYLEVFMKAYDASRLGKSTASQV